MTDEKLKDGEHREYNKDRVLTQIYHTKNGQLDGEYQEFNDKGEVMLSAEYREGKLNGKRISRVLEEGDGAKEYELGKYNYRIFNRQSVCKEEDYDNGVLQHRKVTYNSHYQTRDDNDSCDYSEDMKFENGREYKGHITVDIVLDADDVNSKSYRYEKTIVNGERDGKYHWKETSGNEVTETDAYYKQGTPDGKYSKKREKDTGEYFEKDGEYRDGQFTGTETSGDKSGSITEEFCNGQKVGEKVYAIEKREGNRYSDGQESCIKYERNFYPNGILKNETAYHTGKNWLGDYSNYFSYTRDFDETGKETMYKNYSDKITVENGKNMTQVLDGKTVECEVKKVNDEYIKDGAYKERHNDWVMQTGTYKDGQKNGVFTEYNSDGTVASVKHYKDGKDDTKIYEHINKLRKMVAKGNVSQEKGGVLPKRSKLEKNLAIMKARIKEIVN